MDELLIILGSGATAAISEGTLPVGKDFFSSRNSTWSSNSADYPHLAAACQEVAALKSYFGDLNPVSLTDVWLFLDTVLKYHSATRQNKDYDYDLLRIRYDKMGKDVPIYLQLGHLNAAYSRLSAGMHPLFSPLRKRIYDTLPQDDAVVYFLVVAGWELKHLLYRTYDPREAPSGIELYRRLLAELQDLKGHAVISFNYDIFFEMSCSKPLHLLAEDQTAEGEGAIDFCKPHGGWNIRHVDNCIMPFCSLTRFVEDTSFDKLPDREERPAMIPYFSYPDEIEIQHRDQYPQVGQFFRDQHHKMKKLFQNAKNVVSIGYSFSKDDRHVRSIVEKDLPSSFGRGKRMFCALRGSSYRKDIMDLWKFDEEDGKTFSYYGSGFENTCIDKIKTFLKY
ncbi:hypothetical protein CLG94_01745 [Candidatus Methylomirabilis limnetica]|uniref:SIR2-like domain-containing protein n=1 Tax=Candidatus Methylomirabilis limnetica TaxID=2033718 RepID=A0A2T4U0X1_9BACT|nr:hypothetical protein [Candidatus Methylomirabilis limnetica]PTL37013.1 hypothetical protein CLG94_01745 [Candidatus Methylomirabilis limnetica]